MKIGIHSSSISYSERWIAYCKEKLIPYKVVDCYKSDIIQQLEDCDGLMWHFYQADPRDYLCAKQILYALQVAGKKVFPDFNTCWHFDDKVGQKYLLEAIGAPLVPTYVFYSRAEALQWAKLASFPKVFKLRGGASSANVRLVKTRQQANRIIKKAFRSGFRRYDPSNGLKERWRRYRLGKSSFTDLLEALGHFLVRTDFEKVIGREKGYVYFQDFIEGCTSDIRVKVVDDKCWVYRRLVRENDFRASGSDLQIFSPEGVPMEVIETAFSLSRKLHLKSVAFDFLLSKESKPLLLEISYGFGYKDKQHYAYWDSEMKWHEGSFNPFGWMVQSLIREIEGNKEEGA
jgi:glutathione synthase/RimK-type ligase-like ATP-grasp enzyme